MKIRNGFVSNSSSSSFIVIDKSEELNKIHVSRKEYVIKVPQTFGGRTDFNRGYEDIYDFGSRLNFAFLIAFSMDYFQSQYGVEFPLGMGNEDFWKTHKLENYTRLVSRVKKCVEGIFLNQNNISYIVDVLFDLRDDYYDENNNLDWDYFWENNRSYSQDQLEYGHVDHQTCWQSNPEILLIFDNLKNFLFGKKSIICERDDCNETKLSLSSKKNYIITLPENEIEHFVDFEQN